MKIQGSEKVESPVFKSGYMFEAPARENFLVAQFMYKASKKFHAPNQLTQENNPSLKV